MAPHEKRALSFPIALLLLSALLFLSPRNKHAILPDVALDASKQNRLLVIAPHCDDEILGAFGLMRRTLENKGIVKVIIVTNRDVFTVAAKKNLGLVRPGPGDYLRLGRIRQAESLTALQRLGVMPTNIVFLGYPDKGLPFLWSDNWDGNKPYFNPFTKASFSPYPNSYRQNGTYTGLSMVADLRELVINFQPTIVAYPHPDDQHPDHWGTYAFVKYALQSLTDQPSKELIYLIHYPGWPEPFGNYQDLPLNPPRSGMATATTWSKLELAESQLSQKEASLEKYTSQLGLLKKLLFSFLRKNELYGEFPRKRLALNRSEVVSVPDFSKVAPGKLLSLAVVNTGEKLIIRVKINGAIADGYAYHLDLTAFETDNPPERLVISYKNHRFKTESRSSGTGPPLPGAGVRAYFNHETNSIVGEVPLKNNRSLLLGAYVYDQNILIDKISWLSIYF